MRAVREKVSVGCYCSGDQPTVALSVGFRVSPPLFLLILMHALSLSLSPPPRRVWKMGAFSVRSFVRRSFFLLQFAQEEEGEEVTDGAIGAKESRLSLGGGRRRLTHAAVCGGGGDEDFATCSVVARCEPDKSFPRLAQLILGMGDRNLAESPLPAVPVHLLLLHRCPDVHFCIRLWTAFFFL